MKYSKMFIGIILALVIASKLPANANQIIKTKSTPMPFVLSAQLNPDNTNINGAVVLSIADDIICKKYVIKKDTALIGTIKKFKASKRYRRNGYFEIAVNSLNIPNVGLVNLKKTVMVKIYNPEIMHRKSKPAWMKASEGILFCSDCAIGGTSLPLYIYEDFKWDDTMKDKSKAKKWGDIFSKTLVVYYIYDFFKKYPDPNYKQGDIVKIKVKKNISKEIFILNKIELE